MVRRYCPFQLLLGIVVLLTTPVGQRIASADAPSPADVEFFEKKVRPLLHEHCFQCHSDNAKTVHGGLRLDTRSHMMRGGDTGPAVVPGKLDASLVISAVRYDDDFLQMPPKGKLDAANIRVLEDWVRRGAPFPGGTESADPAPRAVDVEQGRRFWSFQPLTTHEPPTSKLSQTWSRRRIDPFVLAAMQQQGLTPSPETDRRTLIRRLTFDLTGLPPTPQEIERFINDTSTDAVEELVERLLASPAYGERWARMWLDLARYTDATASWLDGTASAHLYRDWVVESLNRDLPYDEFIRRQLATDYLQHTGPEDLPALGFLGLSPTYWKELKLPAEIIRVIVADEWEERVDVVSRTFLGLTVACARCHDHKFDPITTRDYYAMAGVFASSRLDVKPLIAEDQYAPAAKAKERVAELQKKLAALKKKKPKPPAASSTKEKPTEAEKAAQQAAEEKFKEAEQRHQAEVKKLTDEIAKLKATPHFNAPMAHVVNDQSLYVMRAGKTKDSGAKLDYRDGPRDLHVFIRGNPNRKGELVPRRFLEVLSPPDASPFQEGSGRLELAEAITTTAAPLAARVIVNRIWMEHFGRGLVETPSNFGELGTRPSHPELLDDLAARFVENGWSLKWLHRELVLSATYRQTSQAAGEGVEKDPDNRWLWRMNRRRLNVESWRDAMLHVSGELDRSIGGSATKIDDPKNVRRTLYSLVHRRDMSQMLQIHDFPAPIQHSPRRVHTTTPLQGLFVLNSSFVSDRAAKLAKLASELASRSEQAGAEGSAKGESPDAVAPDQRPLTEQRIRQLYLRLFGRTPSPDEVALAVDFLGNDSEKFDSVAWKQYAQSLLGCNEFLFID